MIIWVKYDRNTDWLEGCDMVTSEGGRNMKKAYMLKTGAFLLEDHPDFERYNNHPFHMEVDEASVRVHEGPVEDWMTKGV